MAFICVRCALGGDFTKPGKKDAFSKTPTILLVWTWHSGAAVGDFASDFTFGPID